MSQTMWIIIGIIAVGCILGALLEIRFVLRRRDHRISEEMNDKKESDL